MAATNVEFTVLERRVRVQCTGPRAAELVADALEIFGDLEVAAYDGEEHDLVLDTSEHSGPAALELLGQGLVQWGIAERRHDLLMLHAGSVAEPSGRAIGFVAASGTGKSTLARTLGRHFGYLGDEVLALRDDASIVPLRKPLSLVVEVDSVKVQVPAERLGLLPAPHAPRLAVLVVLDRQPGARPRVEDVATIDALPLLAPQTSYLGSHQRPLQRLALAVEQGGGCRRITYGESEDLVEVVRDLLGA